MGLSPGVSELATELSDFLASISAPTLLLCLVVFVLYGLVLAYLLLHWVAPKPRAPLPSEKTYQTSSPSGEIVTRQLPCWHDKWLAERHLAAAAEAEAAADVANIHPTEDGSSGGHGGSGNSSSNQGLYDLNAIEPAEVALTVVVPAYNEELRILPALEEMVDYCDKRFGRPKAGENSGSKKKENKGGLRSPVRVRHGDADGEMKPMLVPPAVSGYEILIVNDASADNTAGVALEFARRRGLHDVLRVVTLAKNRGKGGGVTHGFRHARGAYVVFADADGASRFGDLDRLIEGCDIVVDASGRGVAIGSRAHLVGSEAVVQRSALRNFLMKSFHFVLMILTPPATSRLRDTQCGFKLFSRASLPHVVPYMHTEGWIFDIEMLMLAESAPATPVVAHDGTVIGASPGIKVAEVPIAWHEVDGSKMNLVQDSIRMALGLTVLRASWMLGVYRRRLA